MQDTPLPRLVFVLQDLQFGGTQRQVLRLASRIDPSLFSVELWILCSGGGFLPQALSLKIPIHFMSEETTVTPRSLFSLLRFLKKERPDIVVPFTVVPNIWCRFWGRLVKLPLVIGTCRGGGSVLRQKERWTWRLAHHHICNALSLKDTLVKKLSIPEERVTFIKNGIPTLPIKKSNNAPTKKRLLCVGRLVEDKDHISLIRAFAMVAQDHPNATLTVIGDGPLLTDLRHLTDSLGLSKSVKFHPGKPNLQDEYAQCSLFVLPSATEASPNVLLEAAAAGKAIVATEVGGIPQLVIDNQTGLLVKPRSPKQLAHALSYLLDNPQVCDAFGLAGQQYIADNYSVDNMVHEYEILFYKLLNSYKV